MVTRISYRTPLLALAASLGLACAHAPAADPAAHNDPKAVELLAAVSRAYQALDAYSDHGEFVHALTVNGKAEKQSIAIRVSLLRPNKLDVDAGDVRMVSDGKTLTTVVATFKKYTAVPAPKSITFETFRDGPLGSLLFGGPSAPTSALFFSLLADPNAVKDLEEGEGALKLEPDRQLGGRPVRSVLIDMPKGADFRLLVDPDTKLLKGIDWVVDPKDAAADAPPGQTVTVDRIGWSPGAVSSAVPKADAFAYVPPKGFDKVESIERANVEQAKPPLLELVGKPCPEFTLTVLEGKGKTRTISKADLAGKVVLIDFWATWCAPCRAELPEIQKMIEGYAKAGKDVVIIAQSVDQKPRELDDLRDLIEKTFKEEKVGMNLPPVGLVAVDPSGTLGETFHIEAIPALVVLDAKGIVQAAHVGKQTRESLSQEIDTLLEGKSLLAPKAKEAAGRR